MKNYPKITLPEAIKSMLDYYSVYDILYLLNLISITNVKSISSNRETATRGTGRPVTFPEQTGINTGMTLRMSFSVAPGTKWKEARMTAYEAIRLLLGREKGSERLIKLLLDYDMDSKVVFKKDGLAINPESLKTADLTDLKLCVSRN